VNPVRHAFRHGFYLRETAPAEPRGPVLFVHGLGESGLCFERLLTRPELAPWRLLAPDLVGYGRTPTDGRPRSLADHADDLVGLLDALGVTRTVVLGHSMGGVLAVMLAERHPGRVALVVDVDGNTSPGDCVYSGRAAAMTLAEFVGAGRAALLADIERAGRNDEALRGYHASQRLCDPATFHLNSTELVAQSAPEDLARRRAALPVPLVYVAGAPGGACQRTRALLDEARVEVVEIRPAGHWPFIDRPDDFTAALVRVLERAGDGA